MSTPIGQEWLKRHYNLTSFTLTHASFIGSSPNIELTSKGNVEETFVSFLRIPEEDSVTLVYESPAGRPANEATRRWKLI